MSLQGRDVTPDDMKDAILQLTVTEHYYTGVQDLVTLLCDFNDITVKVSTARSYLLLMLCCILFLLFSMHFVLMILIFVAEIAAVTQELWVWLTKHMGLDVCSRIMKVSQCSPPASQAANRQYLHGCPIMVRYIYVLESAWCAGI